jgi:uncharacterized protein (TIGR03067 family)
MTRSARLALAACFLFPVAGLLPAGEEKGGGAKEELKKFQGTWQFVSREADGKRAPARELKGLTITFEGDTFTVKQGDEVVQAGTHKLHPGKDPKQVDAKVTEGEGKGTTMLGIYERKGDTLRACFDPTGKKRPAEFKAPEGSGYMLVVIKRAKK